MHWPGGFVHRETDVRPGGGVLRRALRSPWLRPFNDVELIDELISPLGLAWSPSRLRARVIERREEAADAVTLRLRPNAQWRGFVAGQHIGVVVEIDGRRHVRRYSLSGDAARTDEIQITVKRQAGGRVSGRLHAQAQVGMRLELQPADGDFTLPERLPGALLMVSAGSGITPLHAMLYELSRRHFRGDIEFVHVSRTPQDAILRESVERFTQRLPGLAIRWIATAASGRPSPDELLARTPDYAQRLTLLCGPAGLMRPVVARWQAERIGERLLMERFGLALEADAGGSVEVQCRQSGARFTADSGSPLLPQAERAGLAPRYGCRIGICHTCRYRLHQGRVRNLLTGEYSEMPGDAIQLCVSAACSDIAIEDL